MVGGRRERGSEVGRRVWDSEAFPASMIGNGGQLCFRAEKLDASSFALDMRPDRMCSTGTLASSGDTAVIASRETSAKGGRERVGDGMR